MDTSSFQHTDDNVSGGMMRLWAQEPERRVICSFARKRAACIKSLQHELNLSADLVRLSCRHDAYSLATRISRGSTCKPSKPRGTRKLNLFNVDARYCLLCTAV